LDKNDSQSEKVRLEALVGLTAAASEYQELLEKFADGPPGALRREARRSLRLSRLPQFPIEETPPAGDMEAWNRILATPGDAAAGERLFFSPVGPRCYACHEHRGRGSNIGPDLTGIHRQSSRARIITSILDPSREVAPRFQSWLLRTDDGKSHLGLRLPKAGDDGQELYADTTGSTFELTSEEIEVREPLETSLMPAGLEKSLTLQDLRDLVSFLVEE